MLVALSYCLGIESRVCRYNIHVFWGFDARHVHIENQGFNIGYFICTNTLLICRLDNLSSFQAMSDGK